MSDPDLVKDYRSNKALKLWAFRQIQFNPVLRTVMEKTREPGSRASAWPIIADDFWGFADDYQNLADDFKISWTILKNFADMLPGRLRVFSYTD